MPAAHWRNFMVLSLFFFSGATALIYEVLWSKYLALMFGSTVQAQTVVLAVFMGGLALGNHLFGKLADRMAQPLAGYGYLEGAIGLYAFFFPQLHRAAEALFVGAGAPLLEKSALLLALKGVLAVGLLILPTLLMGGTLPLMAAWLQRAGGDSARWSARFYSTNSLGAVTGSAIAGFYLVQNWGLSNSLQLAAFGNLFIAVAAIGLARAAAKAHAPGVTEQSSFAATAHSDAAVESSVRDARWAVVLVAFTGGVSMGLEVLASRCLALIFGASLQAFAVVLIAFILGIGVGSGIVASPRWRRIDPARAAISLLLGAAVLIGLLVMNIETLVNLYRFARTGIAATEVGYIFQQALTVLVSLVVLGVPAGLLGSVLPLCIRAAAGPEGGLGREVGRLLTWNTLGAVAGSLLTGFVLMPRIGLRGAFGVLALALAAAAMFAAWRLARPRAVAVAAVVGAFLIGVTAFGGEGWRLVLSSGVFRAREKTVDLTMLEQRKAGVKLLFYEDAADATVSIEEKIGSGEIGLRINGKADASSKGDLSTQYLLGHLPMLAKPDARRVFVLGFGSGITGGAVLGHPVEELVIAENCEPVLRAGKFFAPWNRNVLTDARTRIHREDARTVLKLDARPYDIIISEPSNPWMAGVGSVFSVQFYQMCASRLVEDGVMAQWFHVYEMHDGIVSLVLNSFASVFPHYEIWDVGTGDIVLIGRRQPWNSEPSRWAPVFERPQARADLDAIQLGTPALLWARQLASQSTAPFILRNNAVQSDEFPILEYEAPRAFFIGENAKLLFHFDERTWQVELCPPAKREALASIGGAAVRSALNYFGSANPELNGWVVTGRMNFEAGAHAAQRPMPVIFESPLPAIAAKSGGWGELIDALHAAEAALGGEQWREGVDQILSRLAVLKQMPAAAPEWVPKYYAASAARASLARGDDGRTRAALVLMHEAAPGDEELGYLLGVWESRTGLSIFSREIAAPAMP